jgi:hypothetical protein
MSLTIDPSSVPSGYQRPTIHSFLNDKYEESFQSYATNSGLFYFSDAHGATPSHQHSTESAVCRQHTQQETGPRLTPPDRLLGLQFSGSLAIGCAYLPSTLLILQRDGVSCVVLFPTIRFSDPAINKVQPG